MNASKISRFQRHDLRWSRSSMSSALETNRASPWYKWNERRSVQGISCSDARMCCHLLWVIMIINRLCCTIQNIYQHSFWILLSWYWKHSHCLHHRRYFAPSRSVFSNVMPPWTSSSGSCWKPWRMPVTATSCEGWAGLRLIKAQIAGRFLGKNNEKQMWDLSWFIPSTVVIRV